MTLIEVSAALLDADGAGRHAELASLLGAVVQEWPPIGGEWDQDAIRFFRGQIEKADFTTDWGPRYVVVDGRLVASAGFFGPPNEEGHVEIGYSVCLAERRRGIATAAIAQLCDIAHASGVAAVQARTTTTNVASIGALERNGFVVIEHSDSDRAEGNVLLRRIVRSE